MPTLLGRVAAFGRGRVEAARRISLSAAQWFSPTTPAAPAPTAPPTLPHVRAMLADIDVGYQPHAEESVRRQNTWTPTDIRSAESLADSGSLRRAADICEEILADDRASGVFRTRAYALLGSELAFEPGVSPPAIADADADAAPPSLPALLSAAAVKALEGGDWWALFPEDETLKLLVWGWLLGVGVGELVYPEDEDVAPGARLVPRLRTWHPRYLRWDWQARGWFLRTADGEIRIKPGDGRWVLFTPYGSTRPWAHGLWRGLARLWLLKRYAYDDWGKFTEVCGQPTWVGTQKEGTDPKLRRQIASDLSSLGRGSAIGCAPGVDVKLVESTARNWENFPAIVGMVNTAMSVAVIGTNLPTEVVAGAGTGATAQQSVRLDYLRADAQSWSTFSRAQCLVVWAIVNFGSAAVAPWAKYQVDPPEDRAKLAATISSIGDAIAKLDKALAPSGKRTNAVAIADAAGVKMIDLPQTSAGAPTIALAPTDLAKITRVNEGRASAGLGPLLLADGVTPDPDGNLTIDEFSAKRAAAAEAAKQPAPAAPATPAEGATPAAPAATPADALDPADVLTASETEALVAEMNAHSIDRCRHGRNNVCEICGIRRVNGLVLDAAGQPVRDETGAPKWKVAWRPLAVAPPPTTPEPSVDAAAETETPETQTEAPTP